MGGKSTFARAAALACVLAHVGSYVPAESAEVPLLDRVFARVGSADDPRAGQSTFVREMRETAAILKNATDKSFVVVDEIGRGTSTTYDTLDATSSEQGRRAAPVTSQHRFLAPSPPSFTSEGM